MIFLQNMKNQINNESRINAVLDWLRESIIQLTIENERVITNIAGLKVFRSNETTKPTSYLHEPCVCLVVQGTKWVILGKDKYVMNSSNFLITSLDLPTIVQIVEASKEKPYMSLTLSIDYQELANLIVDVDSLTQKLHTSKRGITTDRVTLPLLLAFQQLLNLINEPDKIPIFAPIVKREIFCHLLLSEQGERLRQIVIQKSSTHKIARAIEWLKNHYKEPLNIDDLADQIHMSTSSFHAHFRRLTAMSPLQYQKWLRLNEARRLMLTENLDVTSAAFTVGYESLSQFSREYRRLFGEPPLRDIKKLRSEN
ncbi:MAG: AraC family transcriptional regulator [Proteobacteria bacterium]|nr:AraC family transcriptional regulator [Pseudomonadota bacterium]